MKVLLIRHGETTWNIEGRYQGQEDTHLSERGLQQGHLALAQALLQTPEEVQACIPYYPYAGVLGLCALHASSPQAAVRAYSELWQLSLTSWQQAYARIKELNAAK